MIKKTKLGEDIEILLDKIENLDSELESLKILNKSMARSLNTTFILFQAMQDSLVDSGITTKEDLQERLNKLRKMYEKEYEKEREYVKQITELEYQNWLLHSGSFGNA